MVADAECACGTGVVNDLPADPLQRVRQIRTVAIEGCT